ncbi:MAG: ABC transporter permease [Deltaproteobacteria bacterium]|nr:ABC transporter permease [Deltaproteobacteria bacterium]
MSDASLSQKNQLSQLTTFLQKTGSLFLTLVEYIGGVSFLSLQTLLSLVKDRFNFKETVAQIEEIGIRSTSLTNLIAIFTGMVLAMQFVVGLERFGLQLYTGQIVGIAIMRELAPVLTAVMIAARVGSGITAELGSMNVTEQILAIEAMGANPVQKLVVPRVVATTLCTPLLTILADIIGIFGGGVITVAQTGISARFYFDQIVKTVQMIDFTSGIAKTFFFGFFIGIIACYQGMNTRGGTQGVGRSTTVSVVYASITIFVSDFFLTKLFLMF